MKKIILTLFTLSFVLVSCEDETVRDISGITNYAVFDYEPLVVIPIGGSFTPTASATEDGEQLEVAMDGSVDTNTVGAYTYVYSSTNSDGFDATATQTIIVHDPNIIGTDVSGRIQDKNNTARKGTISLVPGTTSIFYASDFGFSGVFPIYFQMDGDTISQINQVYPLNATDAPLQYDPTTNEFSVGPIQPSGFSYTFEYY